MAQEAMYEIQKLEENMAAYSTGIIPSSIEEIREITVSSEKPFTVILNNKTKRKARNLGVKHTDDLTMENLRGMKTITYVAPANTVSPSLVAQEIQLDSINGGFEVSGYQKLPEVDQLNKTPAASKSVVKFKDPRYVNIDGVEHLNLDTVGVRGVKNGEITLKKR